VPCLSWSRITGHHAAVLTSRQPSEEGVIRPSSVVASSISSRPGARSSTLRVILASAIRRSTPGDGRNASIAGSSRASRRSSATNWRQPSGASASSRPVDDVLASLIHPPLVTSQRTQDRTVLPCSGHGSTDPVSGTGASKGRRGTGSRSICVTGSHGWSTRSPYGGYQRRHRADLFHGGQRKMSPEARTTRYARCRSGARARPVAPRPARSVGGLCWSVGTKSRGYFRTCRGTAILSELRGQRLCHSRCHGNEGDDHVGPPSTAAPVRPQPCPGR
jgi:hypothetical protein